MSDAPQAQELEGATQIAPEFAAEIAPEIEPRQADAETLAEVYRQGVDTAAPSPGVGEYVRDTLIYSLTRFFDWLSGMSEVFSFLSWDLVQIALTGVLLLLVGWLLFVLIRRYLSRRRDERGDGSVTVEAPRRPAPAARDWAEELRLRLAKGDAPAALEALWWWLATRLGVPEADPSWTSRELLVHAGRGDLHRPVRRLDHMIYGPEPPGAGEVGEFWDGLRPLLAPATEMATEMATEIDSETESGAESTREVRAGDSS